MPKKDFAISLTLLLASFFPRISCGQTDTVEIQVNETRTGDDDYITWGPTKCRIRVNPLYHAQNDLNVVLKNDVTYSPPGRSQPLDGDVVFAAILTAGETAKNKSLSLLLPKDCSWVDFYIAGRFDEDQRTGRSSSNDKDTVIEVHRNNHNGPIIGRHYLMVRVRKNLTSLTDLERYRLLDAISKLHKNGMYEKFVEVHDWASRGAPRHEGRINHPEYSYPDAAHRDSNFLPWHRIDLLQFERELQNIHPDVALHYWKLDAGDPSQVIFSEDFYGANEVDTQSPYYPTLNRTPYLAFVQFACDNPLFGWRIKYQGRFANSELLTRFPVDRTERPWLIAPPPADPDVPYPTILPGEDELLAHSDFISFASNELEDKTHNKSHHWMGPPMRDCTVAPADPFFWSFHSWFDRVWAKWQRKYDRFAIDGSNGTYEPLGKFDPDGAPTHAMGQHLEDTMWPWDDLTGRGSHSNPSARFKQSRPPKAPIGPFPESPIAGLWPQQSSKPKVMDSIDYLGLDEKTLPHGYCYDDVPYGVAGSDELREMREQDREYFDRRAKALDDFVDNSLSKQERLASFAEVSGRAGQQKLDTVVQVLKTERDPEIKSAALQILCQERSSRKEALSYAVDALADNDTSGKFKSTTIGILDNLTHFSPKESLEYAKIQQSLNKVANSEAEDVGVRVKSLAALATRGDSGAIEFARDALSANDESVLTSPEAVRILSMDGGTREHYSLLKDQLKDASKAVSLTVLLNSDVNDETFSVFKELVTAPSSDKQIRIAAMHAMSNHLDFPAAAVEVLSSTQTPIFLKREAIALLGCVGADLGQEGKKNLMRNLQSLFSSTSPQLLNEMKRLENLLRGDG